jgi:hypothetical protein
LGDPRHGESVALSGTALLFVPPLLMILFRQKYPRWWFDWNLVLMRFLASRVANGILGSLSFDTNGDPVSAPIAIYRVDARAPPDSAPAAELVLDRVIEPPVPLLM